MKRPSFRLTLATALLALAPLSLGCALQGEGERCDRLNNINDDCDTGLVCKSKADLGGNSDICCPATGVSSKYDCTRHNTNGSSSSSGGGGASGSSSSGGGGASSSSVTSSSSSSASSSVSGSSSSSGP